MEDYVEWLKTLDDRCQDCKHTLIEHEEMGWTCDCYECPWKNKHKRKA